MKKGFIKEILIIVIAVIILYFIDLDIYALVEKWQVEEKLLSFWQFATILWDGFLKFLENLKSIFS